MKNKYLIILSLFLASLISCAQSRFGITQAKAFYHQFLPGTIRVDENQQEEMMKPDTIIVVYLETKDSSIKWETAWANGYSYSIHTFPLMNKKIEIGRMKTSNENIFIESAAGKFLWQLQLLKNERSLKQPKTTKQGQILLKGGLFRKKILFTINELTELAVAPSV